MAKRKSNKPSHRNPKELARVLAHRMTRHELLFLRRLTLANIVSFDFQVRIGFYIADFVFPAKMLIIELDGSQHGNRVEHDTKRDAFLSAAGFTVWRIPNKDAEQWPLISIANYERASEGRGYLDALKWANGRQERATAKSPRVAAAMKPKDERREDFYKRLIKITERHQEAERNRREMYIGKRTAKVIRSG